MKATGWMKAWMLRLMGMPTCQQITQFAYAYLEGELDSETKTNFERHLRKCAN